MLDRIGKYMRMGRVNEIARRYFVMNAFDGAFPMLGILVGTYVAGVRDPEVVLSAGVGAAVALGVSGVSSAYVAEKAERKRELRKLEKAMLKNLERTYQADASRFAVAYTSIVNGLSPMLTSSIILSPFMLAGRGLLGVEDAYAVSAAVAAAVFMGLGAYSARVGGEPMMKNALKMLFIGFIAAAIIIAVSGL